jgi:hypothetical protein
MNINLGDVRYNAQAGAFEARVDIVRGNTTFRYPCQVAGPITMDPGQVTAGLRRKALRMSDSSPDLLSRF